MFGSPMRQRHRRPIGGLSRLITVGFLVASSFVAITVTDAEPALAAPPTGMFTQISAGYNHTCALDPSGAIWCWGSDSQGQLGNGTSTTEPQQSAVKVDAPGVVFVQVSAGKEFTCAVADDGDTWCWGDDSTEQLGDGSGSTDQNKPVKVQLSSPMTQVETGDGHACASVAYTVPAAYSDHVAYCWGDDAAGQLGNGAVTGSQAEPVLVDPLVSGVSLVSASGSDSCLLTRGGLAHCWGAGSSGQIGDGASATRTSPTSVQMPTDRLFVGIASGVAHACAIASNGTAWCWGSDATGQLGDGSGLSNQSSPSAVVMPSLKAFTQIDGGTGHTCALSGDGLAYCWGSDTTGQLGNGSTTGTQLSPSLVTMPSGKRFTAVSAGAEHTCALSGDGLAYCWGSDASGQLGNGSGVSGNAPAAVAMPPTAAGWSAVSGGTSHTCALASDGTVWCWGSDATGQLGNGSVTGLKYAPYPVAASTGLTFKRISAGHEHTCAISTAGTAYCWGSDSSGRLGNGSGSSFTQVSPSAVVMPLNRTFTQISVGRDHSCAIASDGTAWCWGSDASQQLGNGATNGTQHQPIAVTLPLGKLFVQIAVGDAHTCAIAHDGSMYCWGSDASGQLGNGDASSDLQPTPSATSVTAAMVEAATGASHTCAVSSQLRLSCSGSDASGQLGNGAPTGNVTGGAHVVVSPGLTEIVAGAAHTCAVGVDGSALCWGSDASGQLGAGGSATDADAPSAVAAGGEPSLDLEAGANHTCATTGGGSLWCWGSDASGQLGDAGTAANAFEPVEIKPPYSPVTLTVTYEGQGVVLSGETGATPLKIDCPGDCVEADMPYGTTVSLTAVGDSTQWAFAGWGGGACSGTGSCTLQMTSDITVNAPFGVLLTVTKSTAASGTLVSNTSPSFTCGTSCVAPTPQRYAIGTTVRIKATPASGYTMRSWTGCSSSSITTSPPSCSVSMSASKTVSAVFGSDITLTKAVNRASIASNPSGISCGTSCTTSTANFVAGSTVTLTATLSTGYTTIVWTNCTPTANPRVCTFIVGPAMTIAATVT